MGPCEADVTRWLSLISRKPCLCAALICRCLLERQTGVADMKLPERGRFEYNLNTFVLIGGIVVGVASTGATWGYFTSQLTSADRESKDWQQRHEQLHRERLQATTEAQAKTDQRIAQLEIDARKIENLAYRVTVAEQGALSTGKAIEQLSAKLSEQSTDLRVMREIIERQFGTQFQRPMRR